MVYFYLILNPDLGNSSSQIQSKDFPKNGKGYFWEMIYNRSKWKIVTQILV